MNNKRVTSDSFSAMLLNERGLDDERWADNEDFDAANTREEG